jgi:hypothetical protein
MAGTFGKNTCKQNAEATLPILSHVRKVAQTTDKEVEQSNRHIQTGSGVHPADTGDNFLGVKAASA